MGKRLGEKADRKCERPNKHHQLIKKAKRKAERRRAKLDPECQDGYGKYDGWES